MSANEFGCKVATTDEARKIMKVSVRYNRVEDTLRHLGLPPSPTDGQPDLLAWETDGKKTLPVSARGRTPREKVSCDSIMRRRYDS
jgi:hypothetical protein